MTDENLPTRRECGTMQVHRRLLDTDPNYARRLARIEEQAFRAREGLMVLRPGCTPNPADADAEVDTAGCWTGARVSAQTETDLENAILTKARQLNLSNAG